MQLLVYPKHRQTNDDKSDVEANGSHGPKTASPVDTTCPVDSSPFALLSQPQKTQPPSFTTPYASVTGISAFARIVLVFALVSIAVIAFFGPSEIGYVIGQRGAGFVHQAMVDRSQPLPEKKLVDAAATTTYYSGSSSYPEEGYKFYGQAYRKNGAPPDKEVFYTLFRHPKPLRNGVFLEMGALDGVLHSNSLFFEKELGWTGVLIEASGFNFPMLMKNRPNPDVHKFHMAVCSPAGYVTMVGSAGSAGVDEVMTDQRRKTFENKWLNESYVPQKVPCKPLADILEPIGITKLDFFSLDVEGSELIVLNAIDFSRIQIRSILFEMNIQCYDPNDNRPLSSRRNLCHEVLRNHGFCMVFEGMNHLWVSGDLMHHCRTNVGEANPPAVETKDQASSNQISTIIQEPVSAESESTTAVLEPGKGNDQSEQPSYQRPPIIELPKGNRSLNLVTYSDHLTDTVPKFCPLVRSAYCSGYTMWLLGQGDKIFAERVIHRLRKKFARLHEFLMDRSLYGLEDNSILCFLDAHDALVVRSLHDFEAKIRAHLAQKNITILFNSEISRPGLNTGMYCGTTINVFVLLDEVMRTTYITRPELTDQQLIIDMVIRKRGELPVDIDRNHTLLANNPADGYEPSICPLNLLRQSEVEEHVSAVGFAGLPRGKLTKAFPYFLHFAGGMNKAAHKECGQKSCDGKSSRYYDVKAGIHKFCP